MNEVKQRLENATIEKISRLVKEYTDQGLTLEEVSNLIGSTTIDIVDYYKRKDVRGARRDARKKENS